MEKLIKPAEYAKEAGISRQAVYAQIKKGTLPSRNVGGKLYIVIKEDEAPRESVEGAEGASEEIGRLLAAKEETIAVLKETIRDLKETNQMITSTLRSEVELLKEAFGEMKTLYAAQIERMRSEEPIAVAQVPESLEAEDLEAFAREPEPSEPEEREWISLEEFLREQGIHKEKLRQKFLRQVKRWKKKGVDGVRKEKGELQLTPRRAAKLLTKVLAKD